MILTSVNQGIMTADTASWLIPTMGFGLCVVLAVVMLVLILR